MIAVLFMSVKKGVLLGGNSIDIICGILSSKTHFIENTAFKQALTALWRGSLRHKISYFKVTNLN